LKLKRRKIWIYFEWMPSDLPTNVGFPNSSIQMTVVTLLYLDSWKKNWFGEYVQLNFLSLLHDSTLRKLVNIICVIVLLTATLLQWFPKFWLNRITFSLFRNNFWRLVYILRPRRDRRTLIVPCSSNRIVQSETHRTTSQQRTQQRQRTTNLPHMCWRETATYTKCVL
jgi:hypothetical protein